MLIDKTVLVTGSSRGIGHAVAAAFLNAGCRVILNAGHDRAALESAASAFGARCHPVFADVSDYNACQGLFQEAEERFGQIDILINNAGVSYVGLFQDMTPADWDRILNCNLKSVLHCCHLALPGMLRQKQGVIINLSSIWGQAGASCEAVYSASKGGVESFTKALAKEVGPSGIRVNAIACGVMDTQMNAWLSPEDAAALREEISLGRFGKPEEAANLALFLAGDQAAYLNGQVITLDGGRY